MTAGDLLVRALYDADAPLRTLPDQVAQLLQDLQAPPRLAAHLRAVHDVAHQLVDWVVQYYPALRIDSAAVLFGAATHDIGKAVHVAELSGPGSAHELAGRELLLAHGIAPELARFAATHAMWTKPGVATEDLLVSVADKVWKNKRVSDLEDLVVTRLAEASGRTPWEEFLAFDEILMSVGTGADQRLAFQASYPIHADQPQQKLGRREAFAPAPLSQRVTCGLIGSRPEDQALITLTCRLGATESEPKREFLPGHSLHAGDRQQRCLELVQLGASAGHQRQRGGQVSGVYWLLAVLHYR